MPVAIILAMSRRHSVIRSRTSLSARSSARSLPPGLEFLGARDERREIEAEGELDLPAPALSRIALAVRAVAANDEAASTRAARCRRNVDGGMPCARRRELIVGREDDQVVLSCQRRSRDGSSASAFRTASARSDTPSAGRAVQIARKICHLCTALSGGRAFAAIWLATWASVSDRRPKGVVGECDCMSLPQLGKENLLAETAIKSRHETLDCDSRKWDSLSVAKLTEKGFRNSVSGAFFFCLVCSWFGLTG